MKGKIKIFGRCEHTYKMLDQTESSTCDDCLEKIIKEIQQKPEIDDMEKYVEEKARKFYEKLYPHLGIDLDMLEIIEEFITQIIRDVKGR